MQTLIRFIRNAWYLLINVIFKLPANEEHTTHEQAHYEEYPLRAGFARQYRFPN